MRTRIIRLFALIALSALIIGLALWVTAPRIVEVYPLNGSQDVPVGTSVEVTFSKNMQSESVDDLFNTIPSRSGTFNWQDSTLTFTPNQPWPSGQSITVAISKGLRTVESLSLPLLTGHTWRFSTWQTRLAYLWPAGEPADIYTLDPLLGDVKRLTSMNGVLDFSVSPDGSSINFAAKNASGGSDIFSLDLFQPKGEEMTPLSPEIILSCKDENCHNPQISPDGKLLAYERIETSNGNGYPFPQVWIFRFSDGETKPVDDLTNETKFPLWSTDGLLSYYNRDVEAYIIYDPGTQQSTLFPNQTGDRGTWDPDGSAYITPEIFYVKSNIPEPVASSHLMRFDPSTGETIDLSILDDLEDNSPVFSPDGTTIAFARKFLDTPSWTPGRQLWLIDAGGRNARQLTETPMYNHHDFSWSPDGTQIAFVRFNQTILTDSPELWLIHVNEGNPIQLVIGGYSPRWIP
jgi:Tol biopolymer transport system component